jgi:hypothetical protein
MALALVAPQALVTTAVDGKVAQMVLSPAAWEQVGMLLFSS